MVITDTTITKTFNTALGEIAVKAFKETNTIELSIITLFGRKNYSLPKEEVDKFLKSILKWIT